MNKNREIGIRGEKLAEEFFQKKGFDLITRNYRTPYGEIDLVIRNQCELIFVEVKTRTNLSYGYPEMSINDRKSEHLVNSAETYLQEHPEMTLPWRIDVLAINYLSNKHDPIIEWFEDAVG